MSWKKLRKWKHAVNRFALNPAKGNVVAARKHPRIAPYIGKAAGLFTLGIGEKVAQKQWQGDVKHGRTALTNYRSSAQMMSSISPPSLSHGAQTQQVELRSTGSARGVPIGLHNRAAGMFWERLMRFIQRRSHVNSRSYRQRRGMGTYRVPSVQRTARGRRSSYRQR